MDKTAEANKITLTGIGEKLRQAREKKALTLDQAQKQTHIHTTVLHALEEGRCDEILTSNYVKSFLKEYANYLGLDSKALVGEYLSLHSELAPHRASKSETGDTVNLSRIIHLARTAIIVFAVLVLVIVLAAKSKNFIKAIMARRPQSAGTAAAARAQAAKQVKARQQKKAPQAQGPAQTKKAPFTLQLRIKNNVMVELKKDGVILFRRVLPRGAVETFTANNSINIYVGKAESIE